MEALKAFGQELYSNGTPLHYFRQFLAHVQREYLSVKPYMAGAWLLVTKWESKEPTRHRPPLPEPVFNSLVSLALARAGYVGLQLLTWLLQELAG